MALNKYYFKNFDGFIYVEDYEDHKEKERCKIYDENNNYLDYISVMEFDGVWDEFSENDYNDYKKYIACLLNADDELLLFEHFCDSFDYGHSIKQTLNNYIDTYLYDSMDVVEEINNDLKTKSEEYLCSKYDINKIGKYYFRGNW